MTDQHHVAYLAGLIHHRRWAGDSLLLRLLGHARLLSIHRPPVRRITCTGRLTDPTPATPNRTTPSGQPHPRGRPDRLSTQWRRSSALSRAAYGRHSTRWGERWSGSA